MKRESLIVITVVAGLASAVACWSWLRIPRPKPEEPVVWIGPAAQDPRNPIAKLFKGKRLGLWSLKPIQNSPPPQVADSNWPSSDVDRFVLAKLEAEGLQPAPQADRRALVRRLYFDLTGLPATPGQVEDFIQNKDPNSYEALVDRLLDRPEFGEHWARWWLDVVRYSDSNGYDWDEFRPQAWRFRDYVIRSFNQDKPMNRLIREHLCGDEMVSGPPRNQAEQDCLIGTGYLRIGPHDHSAKNFGEEKRERAHQTADLVETTGAAFLGLTLNCAKCHDHKTDPISQADHYRMRAFFETAQFRDDLPINLASEQDAIKTFNAPYEKQLEGALDEVAKSLAASKARLRRDRAGLKKSKELPDDLAARHLTDEEQPVYDAAIAKVAEIRKEMKLFTYGLCMSDDDVELNPPTFILAVGDPDHPKERVQPGFLSVLDPNPVKITKPTNTASSGRRTALADWILADNNPLTARVLANRIWEGVFARGIVGTPNDFGFSGQSPTHPELLDWLSCELKRRGWSLKSMVRMLVNTAVYRQSSDHPNVDLAMKKDADNHLLWRHDLRRLSAEQLRDAMLFVSGQLDDRHGGPPVWPDLPQEVIQANPSLLKENEEKTKGWYPSPASDRNVRSIYLVQKRTVRIPFMETFDQPDNFTTCAMRNVSTVAPQALTLLNGPFVMDTSRDFATLIAKPGDTSPSNEVQRAFLLAMQRPPSTPEATVAERVLAKTGPVGLARLIFNLNEFIYVE